jgi:hypothetical protein
MPTPRKVASHSASKYSARAGSAMSLMRDPSTPTTQTGGRAVRTDPEAGGARLRAVISGRRRT